MKTHLFEESEAFYKRVAPFLLEQEAAHCLPLGILDTLMHDPTRYEEAALLLAVEDEAGALLLVALRTPPHNLVLSLAQASAAVEHLAHRLHAREQELPGVIGPKMEAELFAESWQALTGCLLERAMAQRIYEVEQVEPVPPVPGQMRRATVADREQVIEWAMAFVEEALGRVEDAEETTRGINSLLRNERLYVWEDGALVSMAGASGETPNGIRVSYVYTPPAQRRKGYATTLVAEMSQALLDEGRRFCFLFTDLSNPTTNHIYQTVGYRSVCDVDLYLFHPLIFVEGEHEEPSTDLHHS